MKTYWIDPVQMTSYWTLFMLTEVVTVNRRVFTKKKLGITFKTEVYRGLIVRELYLRDLKGIILVHLHLFFLTCCND